MFELSPIAIWKKKKELMDWLSVCPQLFVLFWVNSLFFVSVFLLFFICSGTMERAKQLPRIRSCHKDVQVQLLWVICSLS